MKNYRIGELSKYLGVTPDFIKYYEKEGLITSIPETSPKLYPFNQSSKILECIKLKNLGFTAKEMQDYLFSDTLKDYRETKQELDYETRKNIAFIVLRLIIQNNLVQSLFAQFIFCLNSHYLLFFILFPYFN